MKLIQISEPNSNLPIQADEAKYAIGIDLGTTNSVVACVINGKPTILGPIIPSVYKNIHSIKRLMGSNKKLDIDDKTVSPVEISSYIISHLKQQAENILGEKVTKAVITVPAHFDDAARNDTKAAANIAGLEILRLINEPTAASVAYGLDNEAEGTYLVYDLGGGTFDISILRMQKGVFQVIATGGDTNLGGDDIDEAIMNYLSLKPSQKMLARKLKEKLSEHEFWQEGEIALSQAELNKIMQPFIDRTINICKSTIKDSKIDPKSIKEIILVGGSTRSPLIKQALTDMLKKPLDGIDPDLVVAMGAAIQANALIHGANHLLLDVISLSIGLEIMGGMNERIINRNSSIPCSVTKYFTTHQDGQNGIIFHVIQGEREMAKDCRSLAKFELKGIPPMKASLPRVAVNFMIDADGLLTITAKEEKSGINQIVEVKPSYGLSKEEIEKMIEDSYINAKEDMDMLNLTKIKLIAQDNINNLSQAIQEDGELIDEKTKNNLINLINKLQNSLNSSDSELIEQINESLEKEAIFFIEARMNKKIKLALQGKSVY